MRVADIYEDDEKRKKKFAIYSVEFGLNIYPEIMKPNGKIVKSFSEPNNRQNNMVGCFNENRR